MKEKHLLNGAWQWRAMDETECHTGSVPGSVLSDMLAAGLVEDPFWRMNEYTARELMGKEYVYSRSFTVDEEALAADRVELVCEGIDTLAAIHINGRLLANVDNMHRTHRLPVKHLLAPGENEIVIRFSSPLRFVREEDARNDIHYASTGSIHGNAALRKAHYMFGWDWGPQLPDIGIFRDIYLEYTTGAHFTDVRVRQFHKRPGGEVKLTVNAEVRGEHEDSELYLQVTMPGGEIGNMLVPYKPGVPVVIRVPEPDLWWPNGLGEQPLYDLELLLLDAGAVQDKYTCRLGLRTIAISTAADEWGNEFCFVVNGQKVFAMGANYIPQDSLLPRVTPERCRRMVAESAEANFNCLRVWGGGYYPDDAFYDACDEYGILVWQDMMFACNVYKLDEHFEENIAAETRDNARRLRHHACLALWCSNNEMEWGWGEGWKRIQGHHPRYKADYLKIFEMVLPRALAGVDDQTYFWPSSPSSGGAYDYPNDPNRGDQHYWEVWHSGKPFTEYRQFHFRFCSEYGFQSFPHPKTLESFTLPEDRNIFSEVMESHQKNGQANAKIFTYVADYFLYPKDLASIAYISQVLQLKAVQYGVEHWRQNRGRCMGSLYWQLNDCWPVASWASIDYYGRWKALHYGAKRFYAPVCASAREREEVDTEITYYVHNETLVPRVCTLEAALVDTSFGVLYQTAAKTTAAPLSASPVYTVDFAAHIPDANTRKRVFARYRLLDENGVCISEGCTLFCKPKHFAYPAVEYQATVSDLGEEYELHVAASGFAQYVELSFAGADCVFSDNFFDIADSAGVTVRFDKNRLCGDVGAGDLAGQLVIQSIKDTYTSADSD